MLLLLPIINDVVRKSFAQRAYLPLHKWQSIVNGQFEKLVFLLVESLRAERHAHTAQVLRDGSTEIRMKLHNKLTIRCYAAVTNHNCRLIKSRFYINRSDLLIGRIAQTD